MKVLVAIDGSESALRALRFVIDHAEVFGVKPDVILANVHVPLPSPRARAVLGTEAVENYYAEEAESALAPALAAVAGTGCTVTERRIVGSPATEIIKAAQQHDCSMIVMGTHGRSALGNLVMGSVAMRVIAESPIPVLMVK